MEGTVIVYLSKALICFAGVCHPVLVGTNTPTGTFNMVERRMASEGYGGDAIQFQEADTSVMLLHRTYKNLPKRVAAYDKPAPMRRFITNGCVNMRPVVYEELKACCLQDTLIIEP